LEVLGGVKKTNAWRLHATNETEISGSSRLQQPGPHPQFLSGCHMCDQKILLVSFSISFFFLREFKKK